MTWILGHRQIEKGDRKYKKICRNGILEADRPVGSEQGKKIDITYKNRTESRQLLRHSTARFRKSPLHATLLARSDMTSKALEIVSLKNKRSRIKFMESTGVDAYFHPPL
jgi:hypothetical protein